LFRYETAILSFISRFDRACLLVDGRSFQPPFSKIQSLRTALISASRTGNQIAIDIGHYRLDLDLFTFLDKCTFCFDAYIQISRMHQQRR